MNTHAPIDCGWADLRRRLPATAGDSADDVETPCLVVVRSEFEQNLDTCAMRVSRSNGIVLRPHVKSHKSSVLAEMQCIRSPAQMCGVTCQKVCEVEMMVPAMVRATGRCSSAEVVTSTAKSGSGNTAAPAAHVPAEGAEAVSPLPRNFRTGRFTVLLSNQCVGPRKIQRLVAAAIAGAVAEAKLRDGGDTAPASPSEGDTEEPLVSLVFDNAGNARDVAAAATEAGVELGALVECDAGQHRCGVRTPG